MAYLLYCIVEDVADHPLPPIRGVSGVPVSCVSEGGLRAVVSSYEPETAADLPGLMAYRDVIDSCHRLYTVVPMRYGCIFPERVRLLSFLREHGAHYRGLLKELDGLVEMGIRVLGEEAKAFSQGLGLGIHVGDSRGAGRAFLAARKVHYERSSDATTAQKAFARHCRDAFSGLYAKCKVEHLHRLSLYFLVPKGCIEAFQRTFHEMKTSVSEKLLLSGPWPPFNFV